MHRDGYFEGMKEAYKNILQKINSERPGARDIALLEHEIQQELEEVTRQERAEVQEAARNLREALDATSKYLKGE